MFPVVTSWGGGVLLAPGKHVPTVLQGPDLSILQGPDLSVLQGPDLLF